MKNITPLISKIITLAVFFLFANATIAASKEITDSKNSDMSTFFKRTNTSYIIKYSHNISGKAITIPEGCKIIFKGGRITNGTIHLKNTSLEGTVKLTGCLLKGKLKNNYLRAAWICHKDGKKDDAKLINAAIDVCQHIIFDKGTYSLSSTYKAPGNDRTIVEATKDNHIGINQSNVTLEGEKGAILLTKEEGKGIICIYSKPNDIKNSIKNITVKNITFQTKKKNTIFHEQAHCIKVVGVNGLVISGCTINNFYGDAICLGHFGDTPQTGERARNMNVIIKNNLIDGKDHNNRNGISIINGQDVKIENNVIRRTSAKNMPGAIDIEPNNSAYTINNIYITNNHITECNGGVGAIAIVANAKGGPAHNVFISGNHIEKSRRGFFFQVKSNNTTSNIQVENNYVDKNTDPYIFDGEGTSHSWIFRGNTFQKTTRNKIGGKINISDLKK